MMFVCHLSEKLQKSFGMAEKLFMFNDVYRHDIIP